MYSIRKFILLVFIVISFTNCNNEIVNNDKTTFKKATFTSFELSYTNGWEKRITFYVDSNKTYFTPLESYYNLKYGILPDSIFNVFDSIALKIKNKKIGDIDKSFCDCPMLRIKLIYDNDTIKLKQLGNLDKSNHSLIDELFTFKSKCNGMILYSSAYFETKSLLYPIFEKNNQ